MRKRISLLTVLIMGLSLFLFACKPYSNLKLSVSETDVVLYLKNAATDLVDDADETADDNDENVEGNNEPGLGELDEEYPHYKTVTATVSGAKKNTSKEVRVEQTGYVVDIEDKVLSGDTTTFNLVAKHTGNAIVTVFSREGNLKHVINVRVHERVSGIEFSNQNVALVEGAPINLLNQINFTPTTTTQKSVGFFILEENTGSVLHRDEHNNVIETTYAKIENNQLIVKDINLAPRTEQNSQPYVLVGAYSKNNLEIFAEAKQFSILNIVSEEDIALFANNENNLDGVRLQKNSEGQYEIVVASRSSNHNLFNRRLKFEIGEDVFTDINYTVSVDESFNKTNLVNIVNLTNYEARKVAANREFNNFQITQNDIKGEEVVRFLVDFNNFKGQFTIPVYVKFIVKEFPSVIKVTDATNKTLNEFDAITIYNKYPSGVQGAKLLVNVLPSTINTSYSITLSNAPSLTVKTANGVIIPTGNHILSGQPIFLSHNLTDNLPEDSRLTIEVKYSLGTSADVDVYQQYVQTFTINLKYQMGLSESDVSSPTSMLVDANRRQLIAGGVASDIIEVIRTEINSINIIDEIESVRFVRFEGRDVSLINEFNLDVNNNKYFSLDYNRDANAIRLIPYATGGSTNFRLHIKLKNGIERTVDVTTFSSLTYNMDNQAHVELVANVDTYFEVTYNSFNLSFDESNNTYIRRSQNYVDGEMVFYNAEGEIITDEVEDKTALDYTYRTLRSINLKTNSEINLDFYNYIPEFVGETLEFKQVNYNNFVNINRYSYDHFTINKNTETGGIVLRSKALTTSGYLPVVAILSGFDTQGNRTTLEYTILVKVTAPIRNAYITPGFSEIFEKSSLGALSQSGSSVQLTTVTQPVIEFSEENNLSREYVLLNNTIFTYELRLNTELSILINNQSVRYIDYVMGYVPNNLSHIKAYANGRVVVEFYAEDVALLSSDGLLQAQIQNSVQEKIEQIYKLSRTLNLENQLSESIKASTEFRDISDGVMQSFYSSNIRVRVISQIHHFNEIPITASAEIAIKFATKVQNIISEDIGIDGIYFDSRHETQTIKEIGFHALPLTANNRTLIAEINDSRIARIVAGVNEHGEITGLNALGAYTGKITIQMLSAGETYLRISAKDSYVLTTIAGEEVAVPGRYIDYRIKSADGSKANPFEIRSASEFLDIANYSPNFNYVLANDINLSNSAFNPIKNFNGSLSGEFRYYSSGIFYTRYHSINGLNITKNISVENSTIADYNDYNIGIFENLTANAQVSNLAITNANIFVNFNKIVAENENTEFNKALNVGVVAGKSLGLLNNIVVEANINVLATGVENINIGGLVGLQEVSMINNNSVAVGGLTFNKQSQFATNNLNSSTVSITLNSDKNLADNTNKNLGGIVGSLTVLNEHTSLVQQAQEAKVLNGFNAFVLIESLYGEQNQLNGANVGGAVGYSQEAYINNLDIIPTLRSYTNVGGVVGYAKNSVINNSIVSMYNSELTGLNKSAIVGVKNVGGVAGVSEGLIISFTQVKSFINTELGNNYYGDIVLVSGENTDDDNRNIGGLVGLALNNGSNTDLHHNNSFYVELITNSSNQQSLVYERVAYTSINNSYVDATINAGYEAINAPVYVGGLVGFANELNVNTLFKTLNISHSYVVGDVLTNEYSNTQNTSEMWLSVLPSSDNANELFNNTFFNPIIENELGEITSIMFGDFVVVNAVNDENEGIYLAKSNITILKEFREVEIEGQTITQFKAVIETSYESVSGLFVGNHELVVDKNYGTYVGVGELTEIKDGIELYSEYVRNNSFEIKQVHNNNALIQKSYGSINTNNNHKQVGVVGELDLNGAEVLVKTKTFTESYNPSYDDGFEDFEILEDIIFATNSVEFNGYEFEDLSTSNLINNFNFTFGEYLVKLLDSDKNVIAENILINEYPQLSDFAIDYPNASSISFTYSNNGAKWFVYSDINNSLPVLISTGNKLLYVLLPSDITANVLHFSNNDVQFNNAAYVRVDNNKVVLFNNKLIGRGQGIMPSNLNKYRVIRKGSVVDSSNIYNIIEYDFNLNTPNNLPFQPAVKDNVKIISSNLSVVKVLPGGIVEVVNNGYATLTIRSVVTPSISTTIEVMVVSGISSYKIVGESEPINTNVYIDQVKNYIIETYNKINIQSFVGDFEKNNTVGFILQPRYTDGGLVELNNILLEEGKDYVFENIKEFNLKGIKEGGVSFNITPFIIANAENFGESFEGENLTIENIVILNDLLMQNTNFNNLSFKIVPKALMISTNNTTNAKISPTNTTEVKVSFITSAFNLDLYEVFKGVNPQINLNNLQAFVNSGALSEEISVVVKDNILQANLFKINNVLEQSASSVTYYNENQTALLLMEMIDFNVAEVLNASNKPKQLEIDFTLQLSFDKETYSSSADSYNLNAQNYLLTFVPLTNTDISATYNIEITPNIVNRITTTFYAGNEYENQNGNLVFNPKETSSNYIAPGRTGLLKMYLFPEFNNAEFVELTVNDNVKDFISFEQLLEVYDDNTVHSNIIGYSKLNQFSNKLPNNKGIILKNTSLILGNGNGEELFNGSFFVQVSLGANVPVGENVEFTVTAYETINGVKQAVKSEKLNLNVQPLPNVSISYDNAKTGIAIVGSKLELNVVGYNYDDEIDVQIISSTPNTNITIENGKYYLNIADNANIGDVVVVRAAATKLINGIYENSEDEIHIKIVDFIINSVQLLGASSQSATTNTFEILNGTSNELSVVLNAQYSQTAQFGQLTARKQYLESVIAGKQPAGNGQYVNNWKYVESENNIINLIDNTKYYETFAFNQVTTTGINTSTFYSLQGLKVSNAEHNLGLRFSYYYDDFGRVQIYTGTQENVVYETILYTFRLVINDNSTYDHPNPISTVEDFYAMEQGAHYILMSDITLDNHVPFVANVASLDGNGYVINLNRFNTTKYANSVGQVTTGLFERVEENSVIKNLTINIAGLLESNTNIQGYKNGTQPSENSKINLTNLQNVVFGVLAGENFGTLTNIKVINLGDSNGNNQSSNILNKQLFVNTTQHYVNGNEMMARIGGLVGYNSGSISNSFVGQNYYDIINGATINEENVVTYGTSKIRRVVNNNQIQEQNTYNFVVSGGKQIAGFVYQNSGTIANSYLKEVGVINHSEIATNSQTGGFVLNNQGVIYGSFIEGKDVKDFRASNEIYIEAKGFIGGFVYNNMGSITDAYSNITIKSNSGRSGGFVYSNQSSGVIENAYTSGNTGARVQGSTPGQMSAHGYFTGINDVSEYNNSGKLTSVFYLLSGSDVASLGEPATPISAGSAGGEHGNTFRLSGSFSEFNFVTQGAKNDGIWFIDTENPNYGPQLINTITTNTLSVRYEQESTEENVYNYTYSPQTPYGSENNPILVNSAEEFLNAVLSNTKTYYSQKITGQRKYIFGEAGTQNAYIKLVNNLDFSDVAINEFVVRGVKISDVVFAGHLDGNGMSMRGISLLDLNKAEVNENYGLFNQIGLSNSQYTDFTRKDVSTKNNITTIKNIDIYIRQFDATQSIKVGTLAGSIYDANLINVSVNGGEGIVISGRNIVGGVAGLIKYESSEHTVTGVTVNNISVSASYSFQNINTNDIVNDYGVAVRINGANQTNIQFYSYGRDYENSITEENEVGTVTIAQMQRYSYAGGIAGVFDGFNRLDENKEIATENSDTDANADINKHRSESISKFNNLQSVGGGVISAEQAGGLFGLVGVNTHIMNSSYIASNSFTVPQTIIGYNYAGGIVAENYGVLEKVFVEHEASAQQNYDRLISQGLSGVVGKQNLFGTHPNVAIGGIAGFTDNSIILDSYVKVNVNNQESKIAGGIVGIASRQNYISHAFITSSAYAKNIYGGLIGLYNNSGQMLFSKNINNNANLLLDYVVALNTWGASTEEDIKGNLQTFYNTSNFVLRMPEVGNMLPNFANSNDLLPELDEVTEAEEITKYENTTQNIISIDRTYKYIGSLIGKLSLSSSYLTNHEDDNYYKNRGGALFVTADGVNALVAQSRSVEIRPEEELVVVSTTFGGATTKVSSDSKTNNWPREGTANLTGDVLNYDNAIGNQFKPIKIVGADGESHNIFGLWEVDDLDSSNLPDSQSKRWRVSETGALPEYIVGVYSNFTVVNDNETFTDLINNTHNTKNQYFILHHNNDTSDGSYNINTDRAYAFNATFEGVLIGLANESGNNPKIVFNVDGNAGAENPQNTIFKALNLAVISNIDFEINLTTNANDEFYVRNSISSLYNESENFGFVVRDVSHSTISNVNVVINKVGGDEDNAIRLSTQSGQINNFALFVGAANNSTFTGINVLLNTSLEFYLMNLNSSNFAIAPVIAKNTDTSLTTINVIGNSNSLTVNGNDITSITKLSVGGVIGAVKTVNKNQIFRDINATQLNEIDLNLSINVLDTSNSTQVMVGGVVAEVDAISIYNAYYFGSILVGDENDEVKNKTYVGGIVGNILQKGDLNSVHTNSTVKLTDNDFVLTINKTASNNLHKIEVHSNSEMFVGGIVGRAQNTNIKSDTQYTNSNNAANIFVNSYAENTTNRDVYVGGIAGFMLNTTASLTEISNLFNAGEINAHSRNISVNTYIGGLVGRSQNLNILNVYSYADINATVNNATTNVYAGGLVGQAKRGSIENFVVFADVYLTTNVETFNNLSILVGGLFANADNTSTTITVGNGVILTRFFVNEIAVVNSANLSPVNYSARLQQIGSSNVYFVHEFYAQNSYSFGKALSYDAIRHLITNETHSNILAGVESEAISGIRKLGVGFNYASGESEEIYLPNIIGVVSYAEIDKKLNNKITNDGGKLNPLSINDINISSLNESALYYTLDSNITINSAINEFNGFIYSKPEDNNTIELTTQNAFINTNNGIISNLLILNNSYLNNKNGYVASVNNGVVNNIITYGQVTASINTSSELLGAGIAFENNSLIINSANLTVFTGRIAGNNIAFAGVVFNNKAGATINNSYANTLFLSKESTLSVNGLVSANERSARITNSYFSGTVVATDSWNGLTKTNSGVVNNIIYDANNINTASNNQGKRTEFIKSKTGWIVLTNNSVLLTKAFVYNNNIAINYGYPTILNGINLQTNASITFTSTSVLSQNYKKVSEVNYFISGDALNSYIPVYSAGVLSSVNFARDKAVLVADIDFSNYKKSDSSAIKTIDSLGNLTTELVGNDKQISNFISNGLFNTISGVVTRLTINNAIINTNLYYTGTLTGEVNPGSQLVKITVLNPIVMGAGSVGGVAGRVVLNDSSVIKDIAVRADSGEDNTRYGVIGTANNIGGVFGHVSKTTGAVIGNEIANVNVQNISVLSEGQSISSVGGAFGYVKDISLNNITASNLNINRVSTNLAESVGTNNRHVFNPNSTLFNVGGLVGLTYTTKVNNLTIENSVVSGERNLGGLVGSAYQMIEFNDTGANNISVSGSHHIGGVAGILSDTVLKRSTVKSANITGNHRLGGIVGMADNSSSINNPEIESVTITSKYKVVLDYSWMLSSGGSSNRDYNVGDLFDLVGITKNDFADEAQNKTSSAAYVSVINNNSVSGNYRYGLISGTPVAVSGHKIDDDSKIIGALSVIERAILVSIEPNFNWNGNWTGDVSVLIRNITTAATTANLTGMEGGVVFSGSDYVKDTNPDKYDAVATLKLNKLSGPIFGETRRGADNSHRYDSVIFNAYSKRNINVTRDTIKQIAH